jgi:hypothetical protein
MESLTNRENFFYHHLWTLVDGWLNSYKGKFKMLIQKQFEFNGESGKSYTFEVYSKSACLPKRAGIYIITYSHPRGHLSGFHVNILAIGTAANLDLAIANLREKDSWSQECWNYTCILCINDTVRRQEYFDDLQRTSSVRC